MLKSLLGTVMDAAIIMTKASNVNEKTEKKGDRNFVTEYDKRVQEFIQSRLSFLYPDIKFMGEEDNENKVDPYTSSCFICDPIDGTANFRRDYKHSAISLAYVEKGVVVCGVVMNPYLKETFYAERNYGAYLNGFKIQVSDNSLKDSLVAFGTAPYYPELMCNTMDMLKKITPDCEDVRRVGSAALDLCYTACGRHDMFFELSLYPWDYAASIVIIEEAGGIITDRNGNTPPLNSRSQVFAGNPKAYREFFDNDYFI